MVTHAWLPRGAKKEAGENTKAEDDGRPRRGEQAAQRSRLTLAAFCKLTITTSYTDRLTPHPADPAQSAIETKLTANTIKHWQPCRRNLGLILARQPLLAGRGLVSPPSRRRGQVLLLVRPVGPDLDDKLHQGAWQRAEEHGIAEVLEAWVRRRELIAL
jgi:hypothetical protein